MESNDNVKKRNRSYSKIKDHKRNKKELIPPMLTIPGMQRSSWINDRLPEILWAVLVIGNVDREHGLEFFRRIALFIKKNHECFDITMSGINKYPKAKRKAFIKLATTFSGSITKALHALTLFPTIPGYADWKNAFEDLESESDWNMVGNGVAMSLDHQSQAATDCRWIKFYCLIMSDKVRFANSIDQIEYLLEGVSKYPNFGDLRIIRPFIRSSEMAQNMQEGNIASQWAIDFWDFSFKNTLCISEDAKTEKNKKYLEISKKENEDFDTKIDETYEVRNKIIEHLLETSSTSDIDSRHEGAFGLTLYGASIYIEILILQSSFSASGRLIMRTLVETLITFKYLLLKEKTEPGIWDSYREYGSGLLKLTYLKFEENDEEIGCASRSTLEELANEDQLLEYLPINIGHWDAGNLRSMSEEVGLKNLYDKYYNYTSGFSHASWGAVRESVYVRCFNPVHRLHRIPTFNLPLIPSVRQDANIITNMILDCLSESYPEFAERFK